MEPLIDPDIDLRGLGFMPLDVSTLVDSDFTAIATGDEFKAGVLLWCKSWHQVPAGSLPNDDRILANHSGAGKNWAKVRDVALRNWVLCSDGRLYHPVIVEKAIEAWERRQDYQAKREKDAERLRKWRSKSRNPVNETQTETELKRVSEPLRNDDVTRKTETGTETGTEKEKNNSARASCETDSKRVSDLARNVELSLLIRQQCVTGANPHNPYLLEWASIGVTDTEVLNALETARERKGEHARISIGYLNGIVVSNRDQQTAKPKHTGANKHGNFNERDYKRDATPDSAIDWLDAAQG